MSVQVYCLRWAYSEAVDSKILKSGSFGDMLKIRGLSIKKFFGVCTKIKIQSQDGLLVTDEVGGVFGRLVKKWSFG